MITGRPLHPPWINNEIRKHIRKRKRVRGWYRETGLSPPVKYLPDRSKAVLLSWIILCSLCLVFVMLSRLFIAALWSSAGKGLTSWLLNIGDVNCIFVTFPCGILGQVWYLIVSFPDFCRLSYFHKHAKK